MKEFCVIEKLEDIRRTITAKLDIAIDEVLELTGEAMKIKELGDIYKRALELACECISIELEHPMEDPSVTRDQERPKYWIELAKQELEGK